MNRIANALLTLPSGYVVLQRKTYDAPYGAGLLCFFGGWFEKGETASQCVKRELAEETSLDSAGLNIGDAYEYTIPASDDFPEDRRFFAFVIAIKDEKFQVYEGEQAESHDPHKLLERDDLAFSTRYFFEKIYPEMTKTGAS